MTSLTDINIFKILGTTLNTREATYLVFKAIDLGNTKTIQLDFSGVEFMSRSFADEFYKYRRTLETENNIQIVLVNMNKDLSQMLQAVTNSNTIGKLEIETMKFNHIKFKTQEELSKYLSSL